MKIFVYTLFFHLNTLGRTFSQSFLQLSGFYRPHTHDSLIIVFRWFYEVHYYWWIINFRGISYSPFSSLASNHSLPFCSHQQKTATWLHFTTWLNIIKLSIDNKPLSIKLCWMIYLFTNSDCILIWLKGIKKLLRINCLYICSTVWSTTKHFALQWFPANTRFIFRYSNNRDLKWMAISYNYVLWRVGWNWL